MSHAVTVFDDHPCELGEGALWHPERQALFWFDILHHRLHSRALGRSGENGERNSWAFDQPVSAAACVSENQLLIASASALMLLDLNTDKRDTLALLENDNPLTRSNDGRADPWGGFWIGTMGRKGQTGMGAIYRYYRGELRKLIAPLSIPNAICFDQARSCAYFADTPTGVIWRQPVDERHGWPSGEPVPFINLASQGLFPDGAITDSEGQLWNAQWGASQVACYSPEGKLVRTLAMPAPQVTCPAFGGPDYSTLWITSAREGLDASALTQAPASGQTFSVPLEGIRGIAPPRVLL